MRIKVTEVGPEGEAGEHYEYVTDIDVADVDEAYVKGREFQKLTWALARGLSHQADEEITKQDREEGSE